jgi:ATP-dependent DNA helicase RecQ
MVPYNNGKSVTEILQSHFDIDEFRLGQREIISSVLEGRDVLAVLPTGGGKSLCYQYPAVHLNKLVIVVSPLIALMKDQVASLTRIGIPSGCLHSGQSQFEKREVFRQMAAGRKFVLYLSPERTQKDGFQNWLKNVDVALFAIDEAHCVSQWGHDFRAEYSQLKSLKDLKPDVPVLALTASATPLVLNDIAKQLGLKSPVRHVHGFYRPNLYYQVETCEDTDAKLQLLRQALRQNPEGRILIYCGTRRVTEELALELTPDFAGVDYYHAGLSADKRTQVQEAYDAGQTRILIATNAFGMGIDHPDARLVVHFQMPANIDSLYQEMGRAGRDGKPSTCILLYAKKDKGLQSFFIQKSQAPAAIQSSRWRTLENLVEYCEGSECRHSEILTYYQDSQRIQRCGHCDVCDPTSARRIQKPLSAVKAVLQKVARRKKSAQENATLTPEETRIFEILRLWRREKARELDVPAFVVFSDRTLRHLAQLRPTDTSELKNVYGLGDAKIERFGSELINGPLAGL